MWLRVCKNVNTYHHEGVAEGVAEKNYESFSDGSVAKSIQKCDVVEGVAEKNHEMFF